MSVPSESNWSIEHRSQNSSSLFSDSVNRYCSGSSVKLIGDLNKQAIRVPRIASALEENNLDELCQDKISSSLDQELSEQFGDNQPRLGPRFCTISPKSLAATADDEPALEFSRLEADYSIKEGEEDIVHKRNRLECAVSPKRILKIGAGVNGTGLPSFRFELYSTTPADAGTDEWDSLAVLGENESSRAVLENGPLPQSMYVARASGKRMNTQRSRFHPKPILKSQNPRTQASLGTGVSSQSGCRSPQSSKYVSVNRSSLSPKKRVTWSKMSMVFVYHHEPTSRRSGF